MKSNIESGLRHFICDDLTFTDEGLSLGEDESLIASGIIDSTGVMQLVDYISSEYGFDIPVSDISPDNFDTITRIASYIRRRVCESEVPDDLRPTETHSEPRAA